MSPDLEASGFSKESAQDQNAKVADRVRFEVKNFVGELSRKGEAGLSDGGLSLKDGHFSKVVLDESEGGVRGGVGLDAEVNAGPRVQGGASGRGGTLREEGSKMGGPSLGGQSGLRSHRLGHVSLWPGLAGFIRILWLF